jgi:hypothetical protein
MLRKMTIEAPQAKPAEVYENDSSVSPLREFWQDKSGALAKLMLGCTVFLGAPSFAAWNVAWQHRDSGRATHLTPLLPQHRSIPTEITGISWNTEDQPGLRTGQMKLLVRRYHPTFFNIQEMPGTDIPKLRRAFPRADIVATKADGLQDATRGGKYDGIIVFGQRARHIQTLSMEGTSFFDSYLGMASGLTKDMTELVSVKAHDPVFPNEASAIAPDVELRGSFSHFKDGLQESREATSVDITAQTPDGSKLDASVMNTHIAGDESPVYRKMLNKLAGFMKRAAKRVKLAIICGDMNSSEAEFRPAAASAGYETPQHAPTSTNPEKSDADNTIDHCSVAAPGVIIRSRVRTLDGPHDPASDHRPVLARYKILGLKSN